MKKSKIRADALAYERQVAESKRKADRRLSGQASTYERKLTDAQIKGAVAFRNQALRYERKITDSQFNGVQLLANEHRAFHDREHILYDDAIEKAAATLAARLTVLETDLDRVRGESGGYLTVSRFEREHEALMKHTTEDIKRIEDKVETEAKVTVRQESQSALLERLSSNNRWLIGLGVGIALTLATTVLHLMKLI